jgi:uncharacterized protein (DUF2267 family)
MSMDTLLDTLSARGLTRESGAKRALEVTLAVLGERLTDDESLVLVSVLPPELAVCLEDVDYDADFDTEELFERVRRREQTTPGRAAEIAEVVLAALGECLDGDIRGRVARGLPAKAARIFLGEEERGAPPPHPVAPRGPKLPTLASARPGSTHPISEAAPFAGHSHSVARSDSPHAETKLSGAKGLTQERLDETLGAGRPPGPARPLADSRSK